MGTLLLQNKKYADAVPGLEQAYQKDPTPANRVALAAAYQFNRQLAKATPLFAQAVAADPENYDVRMMYARVLRDQKQYGPAAQQFAEALRRNPESREAWKDLASMLYLLENFPKALEALDRARQLGEDTPANAYFHAIIYDKLRDLKPALSITRSSLPRARARTRTRNSKRGSVHESFRGS